MPCTKNSTSPPAAISRAAFSKERINSRPIILRLVSGSVTPASALKNCSTASTTTRSIPVAATKSRCTCSDSPLRNRPWSTNTQVSCAPTARCTIAAATAESTPPERPHITRLLPIRAFALATSFSAIFPVVQFGVHPAMLINQFLRIACPCSECKTSGWNCTPAIFPVASSKAAIGVSAVTAQIAKPAGACVTASPCDIHTLCAAGRDEKILEFTSALISVRPNSDLPVWLTTPPRAAAIAWNP